MWVVSGWKTVKRAAALRQNFIALLAYINELYSSRSKLFEPFLDYDSRRASRRDGMWHGRPGHDPYHGP